MSDRWKRAPVSEIIALPLSKNVDFAPDDSQRFYYPDPSNSSRIFLIDKRDLVSVIVNVIQPLWQVMKGNLIALAIAAGNMLRYVVRFFLAGKIFLHCFSWGKTGAGGGLRSPGESVCRNRLWTQR